MTKTQTERERERESRVRGSCSFWLIGISGQLFCVETKLFLAVTQVFVD